MSDPIRLLDEEEKLSADERRILESDLGQPSPRGARREVWGALSIKLVALSTSAQIATTSAGASASGATTLSAWSLLKFASIGAALGAAVSLTVFFTASPEVARPSTVVPLEASAAVSAGPAVIESRARDAAPVHSGSEGAAPPKPSARVRPAATTSESNSAALPVPVAESESLRVARARAHLRSGDARRALDELRAVEQDEPHGLLIQEREALLIEALSALGQHESARERGRAFLKRYPSSPHVHAIERVVR